MHIHFCGFYIIILGCQSSTCTHEDPCCICSATLCIHNLQKMYEVLICSTCTHCKILYSETSIIRHSMGLKLDVRLQRLLDYPVIHSTVKHGECISE